MYIVTAKEMCDIDQYTIGEIGMDSKLLMENAGREISRKIEALTDKTMQITIVAGGGKNGGDGFSAARTLLNKGYRVQVIQAVLDEKITGDTHVFRHFYIQCGGMVVKETQSKALEAFIRDSDVIVDAFIGTGVKGMLRDPAAGIVRKMNEQGKYIISVDIPSGLPADEGVTDFEAVRADFTIVISNPKRSAFVQHTAPYYGNWEAVEIGLPSAILKKYENRCVLTAEQFERTMPKRNRYAHKGNHGKGLVIGGNKEMPGALLMTVKAALKTGAGLITAGTVRQVINAVVSQCPEATYMELAEKDGFLTNDKLASVADYDGIALGIGLGRNDMTGELVKDVISRANAPVVLDADGLYHIRNDLDMLQRHTESPVILTPHPGEMAMLLHISVQALLEAPFHYVTAFAKKHGVYVVLKGAYTIIAAPDGKQAVSTSGNPGLAKGGSGDVLTGIILAMVMQEQSVFTALCNACFVHGKSAELLTANAHSYYDLMASDVIQGIPDVYRTFL